MIAGDRTTVDRIELSGAAVADRNGAGIRQEGTDLTVTRSWFHDNENGILTGADPDSDVVITRSRFFRNGFGDGYSHNLYVGAVRSLTVTGSWFAAADTGHELKSRAARNTIVANRISDGDAAASYSIDLPNGGRAMVAGNVIVQGPRSENPALVSYGAEGLTHPSRTLWVVNNTFVNRRTSGTYVALAAGARAHLRNNLLVGPGDLASGASAEARANRRVGLGGFVDPAPRTSGCCRRHRPSTEGARCPDAGAPAGSTSLRPDTCVARSPGGRTSGRTSCAEVRHDPSADRRDRGGSEPSGESDPPRYGTTTLPTLRPESTMRCASAIVGERQGAVDDRPRLARGHPLEQAGEVTPGPPARHPRTTSPRARSGVGEARHREQEAPSGVEEPGADAAVEVADGVEHHVVASPGGPGHRLRSRGRRPRRRPASGPGRRSGAAGAPSHARRARWASWTATIRRRRGTVDQHARAGTARSHRKCTGRAPPNRMAGGLLVRDVCGLGRSSVGRGRPRARRGRPSGARSYPHTSSPTVTAADARADRLDDARERRNAEDRAAGAGGGRARAVPAPRIPRGKRAPLMRASPEVTRRGAHPHEHLALALPRVGHVAHLRPPPAGRTSSTTAALTIPLSPYTCKTDDGQ